MRNKPKLQSTSEFKSPNTPDLDRTYVLSYIYDGEFMNKRTMAFSGVEIQKALDTLPQALLEGESAEGLKDIIRTNIVVGGRLLLNKPLASDHPEQTINMMKRANGGCEETRKFVRFCFATYLGLNLDEIHENDSLSGMPDMEEGFLFVFDQDYREMSFDEETLAKTSPSSTANDQMKGVQA